MPNYRLYQGQAIFQLEDNKAEAIVEGLIYENDTILIVAPPKMSKIVFAMQLACNLSSGTQFLNFLDIPRPVSVLYIATEMKDDELKDRFIRTSHFVDTNVDNLALVCTKGANFKLNTPIGRRALNELITLYKQAPPKVVFIDSVYKAFYGSLTKDDVVNEFLTEVDRMSAEFDCAVVLVHHSKKATRDKDNMEYASSDADTYGSQFLIGSVDHIIRLEKIRKESAPLDRFVRCETQRTGKVITDIRIRLNEPDPLYFHMIGNVETEKASVLQMLTKETELIDISQMMKKVSLGRTKMYQCLKELLSQRLITKEGTRTKLYGVRRSEI